MAEITRIYGMNERIQKLREQSLSTTPTLSIERAALMTEAFYTAALLWLVDAAQRLARRPDAPGRRSPRGR